MYHQRIDWKMASIFLSMVWIVSLIYEVALIAIAWTGIIAGYDLLIKVLSHFEDKEKQQCKNH